MTNKPVAWLLHMSSQEAILRHSSRQTMESLLGSPPQPYQSGAVFACLLILFYCGDHDDYEDKTAKK